MDVSIKVGAIVRFLDNCGLQRYGQIKKSSRVKVIHVVTKSGYLLKRKRKTVKGWAIRTHSYQNGKFNYNGDVYYVPEKNIKYNTDYPVTVANLMEENRKSVKKRSKP